MTTPTPAPDSWAWTETAASAGLEVTDSWAFTEVQPRRVVSNVQPSGAVITTDAASPDEYTPPPL